MASRDTKQTTRFVTVWFPHDAPKREKSFDTAGEAIEFAQGDVLSAAPMVIERVVVSTTTEAVVWNCQ